MQNKKIETKSQNKLWNFLASTRLALMLLILLAILSLSGILIIQRNEAHRSAWKHKISIEQIYQNKYGEIFAWIILKSGMHQTFTSWWYLLTLGLVCINLILCTIEHFPSTWRQTSKITWIKSPEIFAKRKLNSILNVKATQEQTISEIQNLLHKHLYKTIQKTNNNDLLINANKNAFGRFGYIITHISLLLIVIGGVIFALKGYRYTITGKTGHIAEIPNENYRKDNKIKFLLRIDDIELEFYDDNEMQIKDYKSTLTIIDDNEEKISKTIEVNHPLTYNGIMFYQSNYFKQAEWNLGPCSILVSKPQNPAYEHTIILNLGEKIKLPDTEVILALEKFVPDFALDKDNKAYSQSEIPRNPAFDLALYEKGELLYRTWLFPSYKHSDYHTMKNELFNFELEDYDYKKEEIEYTGIEVSYNPGAPFIWCGFALIIIGLLISFYIPHRRLWILIRQREENNIIIYIEGQSNKDEEGLENEMKKIKSQLKKRLGEEKKREE